MSELTRDEQANIALTKSDNGYCFDADTWDFIIHAANQHHALVEALEKLACLGNGDYYGNSEGNVIAQKALGINPRELYGTKASHTQQEPHHGDISDKGSNDALSDAEATGAILIDAVERKLEHTQGALTDSIEANGHLQDENDRYKAALEVISECGGILTGEDADVMQNCATTALTSDDKENEQ